MSTDYPSSPSSTSGASSDVQSQAGKDFNDLTEKSKQDFDAASTKASEDIQDLGHQAKDKLDEASANARSFADDQKNLAADQITGIASAIKKVAIELDSSDQQVIARYARDLAQGLSQVGTQLQQRDTDDLIGAAEDFGRKQPLAFLGAAALTGFMASRFALASAHRRAVRASDAPTSQTRRSDFPSSTTTGAGAGTFSGDR